MEINRYVNAQKIPDKLPPTQIQNPAVVSVLSSLLQPQSPETSRNQGNSAHQEMK